MNWKDIIVGAIATLVVTIISGIAVYYLTKEPPARREPKLHYDVESLAQFAGQERSLIIQSVRLANTGNVAATSVVGAIDLNAGEIADISVKTSTGDSDIVKIVDDSESKIKFGIESLLPGEQVSISILVTGSAALDPAVTIRSAEVIGEKSPITTLSAKASSGIDEILRRSLTALIIVFFIVAYFVYKKLRKLYVSRGSCANNIAFVLLHSGEVEEAYRLLCAAIERGEDAPHSISNIATCLELRGELDASARYLSAAEFYARTAHEKAVVEFNKSVCAAHQNDLQGFIEHARTALSLSKEEIFGYLNASIHVKEHMQTPEAQSLLSDRKGNGSRLG